MALDGIPAEQAEPAHLPRVLRYIAQLRGVEEEVLAEQVAENLRALLG
jgi:Tat protein secretion system quality control protein TatD with DNase activity